MPSARPVVPPRPSERFVRDADESGLARRRGEVSGEDVNKEVSREGEERAGLFASSRDTLPTLSLKASRATGKCNMKSH
jgi:hypothetical protein